MQQQSVGSRSQVSEREIHKQHLAEFLLQKVGLGAFRFRDVEVVRLDGGQPELRVSGAAEALAAERGVRGWRVSLTHTSSLAEAVVVAL